MRERKEREKRKNTCLPVEIGNSVGIKGLEGERGSGRFVREEGDVEKLWKLNQPVPVRLYSLSAITSDHKCHRQRAAGRKTEHKGRAKNVFTSESTAFPSLLGHYREPIVR